MSRFLAAIYSGATAVAQAATWLPWPGSGKLARTFRERRRSLQHFQSWAAEHRDTARPLLWIHAPSVGEGLQARPVLERLREAHPDWQFCYTHFSPSAEPLAASLPVDVRGYLPFDRAPHAAQMLDALRPTAIVFAKLDVWPTLTECAAARGVALGLISATMSEGSARRGMLAQALSRNAFGALAAVGAVDPADADRLVGAGVIRSRMSITGDTRYDQVAARAATVNRASALLAPLRSTRPTVVAGSTWPADEQVIRAAWRALRVAIPDARLIIAPHEPTEAHLTPARRWATEAGLRIATLAESRDEVDVLLVDRVGVLGDLYALADAAFVGGGFHAAGLHSVLEPAAFGVPVVFGPRYHASRDARLLTECRGGESVHDVRELVRALRILLTEDDTRRRAGRAALAMVRDGLGAAERSARMVEWLMGMRRET